MPRICGQHSEQEHISGILLPMTLPQNLDLCKALPVFHAIIGCDTVSFIAGRGKLKAWEALMAFLPVAQAFLEFAACKEEISTSTLETF